MYLLKRLKRLFVQRQILKTLVVKELKAKYVGSALGVFWAIINPLLLMIVISFVFTKIMKIEIESFPLFVLCAILPWMFFSSALSESSVSLINNAQFLKQFTIPREFLPIGSVLANFLNFLFGLALMIPVFAIFRKEIIPFILALPIPLFSHLIFTLGIALILSFTNIYFRDVGQLLGIGLMFWFWITPIFYSFELIPLKYRWVCAFNPMTIYINMYRDILFNAKMPSLIVIIKAYFISLSFFLLCYFAFIKKETSFIKRI